MAFVQPERHVDQGREQDVIRFGRPEVVHRPRQGAAVELDVGGDDRGEGLAARVGERLAPALLRTGLFRTGCHVRAGHIVVAAAAAACTQRWVKSAHSLGATSIYPGTTRV
jgi:hypothetical protein